MRIFSALILLVLTLAACNRAGYAVSGSGSPSVVKVFRKADGETMFFAGPMNYKSGKASLAVDFTLNQIDGKVDSVVCNFTYSSPNDDDFKPKRLELDNGQKPAVASTDFELFYAEKRKKRYTYRYSCRLSASEWIQWMNADGHSIVLNELSFTGGAKHKRHVTEVRNIILFPLSRY